SSITSVSVRLNPPPPPEPPTLSLHDALPICGAPNCTHIAPRAARQLFLRVQRLLPALRRPESADGLDAPLPRRFGGADDHHWRRAEEHTSELQSRENLVCRLLLE